MITYFVFFFCKQKTAYEMRISDWSSDVCSSDLAAIGIYQAPGANAVAVAEQVTARMDEPAQRFPEDIEYLTVYDTTVFVTSTIEAIIHTLLVAFLPVSHVVFGFLGKPPPTTFPMAAVTVSTLGTFPVLLVVKPD